jgi:transposase InsO family protein
MTPIPARIMESVSLDIFSPPPVFWQDRFYDACIVVVDRHSGWIVAIPTEKEGLTAEKAAHLVMEHGWSLFVEPRIITTDQGPQFTGQWWRTMCARLGVRTAFSQAYRPQANGRAERAGKTLWEILRKLDADHQVHWVEALPKVLRIHHDTPNDSGLTPYNILFGRDRYDAGLPYEPSSRHEMANSTLREWKVLTKSWQRYTMTYIPKGKKPSTKPGG